MTETSINYQQRHGHVTGRGGKEYMKHREYKRLQLFAEGEGGGAAGNPASDGSGVDAGSVIGNESLSFDDFLSRDGNQAEFDRRVQKAIQTAVSNAQKKWKTLTDTKVSEAEKLAQLTGEEREKYRADKAEQELADLRRQIAMGDMAKTARKMLSDEGVIVPDEIVSNLISDDAEKTKTAVDAFVKVFKEAVQTAVKEALRGNAPKQGGSASTVTREQILAVKDRAERQKLIAENPQLFVRR